MKYFNKGDKGGAYDYASVDKLKTPSHHSVTGKNRYKQSHQVILPDKNRKMGFRILLNGTERECWDYIENNGIENAEIKPITPSFK